MDALTPEELTIACAERMGWKPECWDGQRRRWVKGEIYAYPSGEDSLLRELPDYSGSMDAAMALVEAAEREGWDFMLKKEGAWWEVLFWHHTFDPVPSEDPSRSAAICLAFLKLPQP